MNEKQYVNAIVRKIRCSKTKKKEIRKQLLSDIRTRTVQGESLENIISQMGSISEIALSFNETIPPAERKQYSRNRILKIAIPVVLILLCLLSAVYWLIPKSRNIADSKYFSQDEVEEAMKHTIELLDAEDYSALQEDAIPQMQPVLNAQAIAEIKNSMSDNWGQRILFGTAYMTELIQGNTHYAVGEITVTYENISVTYRLTFDQDMRFAGIYIR